MTKINVLSIDDSIVIRKLIKKSLEPKEFIVKEANDGEEGLEVLRKDYDSIKLILLDWNMPGMNGFEFLKKVKSDLFYSKIPIIMVTTENEKEAIVKALQAGISNYILKPFSNEELLKKVNMYIKDRG